MRPHGPGPGESFDALLDTADSPPEGMNPSSTVITVLSSPTSPEPGGGPVFSPSPMELPQDHEDASVEELLSPEAKKRESPGMVKRHDVSESEIFIFKNNLEYFEAITTSYQIQMGNSDLGQAVIMEEPDQKRTSILKLANVVKDLFKENEENDTEEKKFAHPNLQLHSLPVVNHITSLVKTIASQEDLTMFYTVANIKNKMTPSGPSVNKNTQRKLAHWTSSMDHLSDVTNNFIYEQLKVDPTSMANKTIQTAKEAVAVLMKENVMLKMKVKTMEESENIFKETTINHLTSIDGGLLKQDDRMKNLETQLQLWTSRNPTRTYNEVAAGYSDWWTCPDPKDQPDKCRTEPMVPQPKGSQEAQNLQQIPPVQVQQEPQLGLQPVLQKPLQEVQQGPLQPILQGPLQVVQHGPAQQVLQQTQQLTSQGTPRQKVYYGGQPGPVPHGPAMQASGEASWDRSSGLRQRDEPREQHQRYRNDLSSRTPASTEAHTSDPSPVPKTQYKMIRNPATVKGPQIGIPKLFPMSLDELNDETTLARSMSHLALFEETVDKIKKDLTRKHPIQMADLLSWNPSDEVQKTFHFISYQLSLKTSLQGLHMFLNNKLVAEYDVHIAKFRFPLLRPGSKYQQSIYDQSSHRMKSENNQQLIALYCPKLAKAIFVVEKVFQKKGHNKFWVDPKEGVTESISSLSMIICILVEQILTDEETASNQPDHCSLQGFLGNPFAEDSDHNSRRNMEWALQGRKAIITAINLAVSKRSFTTQVCSEAKNIALQKNTEFLSSKEKRVKSREEAALKRKATMMATPSPRPSPKRELPLFWN